MEPSRVAAASLAALVGAALTGGVAMNLVLRHGVEFGRWHVRADRALPSAEGLRVESLEVTGASLRASLPVAHVSWSSAHLSAPFVRLERAEESSAAEEDLAGSPAERGPSRPFDVVVDAVELWEKSAASATAVGHDVRLARGDDRSVEVRVSRGMVDRSGFSLAFEGLTAARSPARTWDVSLARATVGRGAAAGAPSPESVDDGDHVDVAAGALEALFLRGREALDRLIAHVPTGTYRAATVALEEVPWLGRAGLVGQGAELARGGDDLRASVALVSAGEKDPLTLRLEASRASHRVVADVRGGALVVRGEGAREGRVEADGRLVFDAEQRSLEAHGSLGVRGLRVQRRWLGGEPFEVAGRLAGRFTLDPSGTFSLESASFELGERRELRGRVEGRGNLRSLVLTLSAAIEPFDCNAGVRALPAPFRGTVGQLRFEGTKSFAVDLDASVANAEGARFDVREHGACTAMSAPASLAPEAFDAPFTMTVIGADGRERLESFGPGTEHWRPLGAVSRSFLAAVLTTEDAGFFRHKGVSWFALRSALVDDLKAKRFVRGGSTISMQLAKNLFLRREKTLGRKLEEVLLTDYLEDAFGKERILELYANVVELGPDVFGVEAAARHHFGVGADELGVLEGFWLATLLPNPRERGHARKDGTVSEAKLKELLFLVRKARSHGLLTDADVAAAEHETLHMPRLEGEVPRVPGLGLSAPSMRSGREATIEGP